MAYQNPFEDDNPFGDEAPAPAPANAQPYVAADPYAQSYAGQQQQGYAQAPYGGQPAYAPSTQYDGGNAGNRASVAYDNNNYYQQGSYVVDPQAPIADPSTGSWSSTQGNYAPSTQGNYASSTQGNYASSTQGNYAPSSYGQPNTTYSGFAPEPVSLPAGVPPSSVPPPQPYVAPAPPSLDDSPYESVSLSETERIDTYTVYKIVTTFKDSQRVTVVRRRYNDFFILYRLLVADHPGHIVPPPPEKRLFGRFNADFVETRRAGLESMLKRVLVHPYLFGDETLRNFLTNTDVTFESYVTALRKDAPSNSFFEALGSVLPDIAALVKGYVAREDDPWFVNKKRSLELLEGQLRELHSRFESLSSSRRDLFNGEGSLWETVGIISDSTDAPPVLRSFVRLGGVYQVTQETHLKASLVHFVPVLAEYLRFFDSIKAALASREVQHDSLTSASRSLASKRQKLDRLMGQSGKGHLVPQAVKEVEDAQRVVNEATRSFEAISMVVRGELDKFDTNLATDLQKGMSAFVTAAIEANKEALQKWEEFALSGATTLVAATKTL